MVGIDKLNMKFKFPTVVSGTPPPVEPVCIAASSVTERETRIELLKLTIRPFKGDIT